MFEWAKTDGWKTKKNEGEEEEEGVQRDLLRI
jgi:hypothetical protein